MDAEVKRHCIEYFEKIGGIESVKIEYRYRFKRAVVAFYTDLYESNLLEKIMKIVPTYPPGHFKTEKYNLNQPI